MDEEFLHRSAINIKAGELLLSAFLSRKRDFRHITTGNSKSGFRQIEDDRLSRRRLEYKREDAWKCLSNTIITLSVGLSVGRGTYSPGERFCEWKERDTRDDGLDGEE